MAKKLTAHSSSGSFIIQNHRGAGDAVAEDTLEAFEFSWKLGMYPEADLRATRDGVIVQFHDKDFSRGVRNVVPELVAKGVADILWDELRKLDIGGDHFPGRYVSSVQEVFEQMEGFPDHHLIRLSHLCGLLHRVNQALKDVSATSAMQAHRQNLLSNALATQRCQHVGKGCLGLVGVSRLVSSQLAGNSSSTLLPP